MAVGVVHGGDDHFQISHSEVRLFVLDSRALRGFTVEGVIVFGEGAAAHSGCCAWPTFLRFRTVGARRRKKKTLKMPCLGDVLRRFQIIAISFFFFLFYFCSFRFLFWFVLVVFSGFSIDKLCVSCYKCLLLMIGYEDDKELVLWFWSCFYCCEKVAYCLFLEMGMEVVKWRWFNEQKHTWGRSWNLFGCGFCFEFLSCGIVAPLL